MLKSPRFGSARIPPAKWSCKPTEWIVHRDLSGIEASLQGFFGILDESIMRANQSQIEPMQKMAAKLLEPEPLRLNGFESQGLSLRGCGGLQQQGEIDHEESVWFQGVRNHYYSALSPAWESSRAKNLPTDSADEAEFETGNRYFLDLAMDLRWRSFVRCTAFRQSFPPNFA